MLESDLRDYQTAADESQIRAFSDCNAGGTRCDMKGKAVRHVEFTTDMLTVRCCCRGELGDEGRAESCSWFIVRSCDPFHGAEYWADELTSNTRCRLPTAVSALREGWVVVGAGGGEEGCLGVEHSSISIISDRLHWKYSSPYVMLLLQARLLKLQI